VLFCLSSASPTIIVPPSMAKDARSRANSLLSPFVASISLASK
jgi:hypothetical protein